MRPAKPGRQEEILSKRAFRARGVRPGVTFTIGPVAPCGIQMGLWPEVVLSREA